MRYLKAEILFRSSSMKNWIVRFPQNCSVLSCLSSMKDFLVPQTFSDLRNFTKEKKCQETLQDPNPQSGSLHLPICWKLSAFWRRNLKRGSRSQKLHIRVRHSSLLPPKYNNLHIRERNQNLVSHLKRTSTLTAN
jgi:hypothetical protein